MTSFLASQVCREASQNKREMFDAQAQRLQGTEAEVMLRQPKELNAKELVRRNTNNIGNFGKEVITTLADWKTMERREREKAERDHGALRQCFWDAIQCCREISLLWSSTVILDIWLSLTFEVV